MQVADTGADVPWVLPLNRDTTQHLSHSPSPSLTSLPTGPRHFLKSNWTVPAWRQCRRWWSSAATTSAANEMQGVGSIAVSESYGENEPVLTSCRDGHETGFRYGPSCRLESVCGEESCYPGICGSASRHFLGSVYCRPVSISSIFDYPSLMSFEACGDSISDGRSASTWRTSLLPSLSEMSDPRELDSGFHMSPKSPLMSSPLYQTTQMSYIDKGPSSAT